MKLSDLRDVLIDFMDAGIAVVIESPPGRGKSMFMLQLIEYLSNRDGFEWGYQTLFMATQTPTEMLGYQFKGERFWDDMGNAVPAGTKGVTPTAVTEPSLPPWMLTTQGKPVYAYKRGVLVIEEWGQGESDAKRAAAQLLLMGELGPFHLPGFKSGKGWGIIALTNGSSHRSGVTKEYDFIINRVAWLKLTDDILGTLDAMTLLGVHPSFLAFAKQHPEVVLQPGVPAVQGPWMTSRTHEMGSKFVQARMRRTKAKDVPLDPITQEAVTGLIGHSDAMTLFNFLRLEQEMPEFDDIIADPAGVPVPEAADAKALICYNLAARVDQKNAAKVLVYVTRLGKEFSVTFAMAACTRMNALVMTPAFVEWSKSNASLVALMQQFRK